MILEISTKNEAQISKLLEFVKKSKLDCNVLYENNESLPGKEFTELELEKLIKESRKSGTIALGEAHKFVKENI